jgi:lipoate-protein ligase B
MTMETYVVDLGLRDYGSVWDLQKRLVAARAADRLPDLLLLVEHPPVITLGRRGRREDVFATDVPVYEVERGGEATYHGPGQLVGYPILKFRDRLEVRKLVTAIEEVLIRASRAFGVAAGRRDVQRGVWVGERKLGSIGMAVHRNVTYHGFAHNVNTDLSAFDLLRPCGFDGGIMTSMAEELGRPVDLEAVKARVVTEFGRVLRVPLRPGREAELVAEARLPA